VSPKGWLAETVGFKEEDGMDTLDTLDTLDEVLAN